MAFLNQRLFAAPDETRHIWKLDGPLEDAPNDEVPSMAWLREEGPAIEANARRVLDLTDQLAALANQHQEAQAAAAFNAERTRLAEWDASQLRGQIGPATTSPPPWPRPLAWRTWTIG